ncbi:Uncharacterised protein [Mannheimia haemolytica]|uniref:Uncharacterized protein n=1 Tax=Mannheimia haemolytica TaxID=75985 RepID=A0A378MU11_MANHA|nr:Uncharacterised protein [Mannheimia haemolytica]
MLIDIKGVLNLWVVSLGLRIAKAIQQCRRLCVNLRKREKNNAIYLD